MQWMSSDCNDQLGAAFCLGSYLGMQSPRIQEKTINTGQNNKKESIDGQNKAMIRVWNVNIYLWWMSAVCIIESIAIAA